MNFTFALCIILLVCDCKCENKEIYISFYVHGDEKFVVRFVIVPAVDYKLTPSSTKLQRKKKALQLQLSYEQFL